MHREVGEHICRCVESVGFADDNPSEHIDGFSCQPTFSNINICCEKLVAEGVASVRDAHLAIKCLLDLLNDILTHKKSDYRRRRALGKNN